MLICLFALGLQPRPQFCLPFSSTIRLPTGLFDCQLRSLARPFPRETPVKSEKPTLRVSALSPPNFHPSSRQHTLSVAAAGLRRLTNSNPTSFSQSLGSSFSIWRPKFSCTGTLCHLLHPVSNPIAQAQKVRYSVSTWSLPDSFCSNYSHMTRPRGLVPLQRSI